MGMVQVRLEDGTVVPVPYPRVPPAPRISARRRKQIAAEWLVMLSQAPTTQRVEALAPLVGRFPPRSPLGRIAEQFVASNRLPTEDAVIEEFLRRQAEHRRDHPIVIPDGTDQVVLGLIDQYQAAHQVGPPWSWLGRQVGLDRVGIRVLLTRMRRDHQVTFTEQPGSLRRTDNHGTPGGHDNQGTPDREASAPRWPGDAEPARVGPPGHGAGDGQAC